MNLRADEISSLIQKQIEGFDAGIELKETGRVISVGDGIARIYGLEKAMAGELLSFPNPCFRHGLCLGQVFGNPALVVDGRCSVGWGRGMPHRLSNRHQQHPSRGSG